MSLPAPVSTWWNELPELAAASVFIPSVSSSCLLFPWETLQDQQVGLTQAAFKLLLLPWVPEHVRCCVSLLRVECLFLTALGTPESKTC